MGTMIKIGDSVYIVIPGSLYSISLKNSCTVLSGKIESINNEDIVIALEDAQGRALLHKVKEQDILSTPQQVLETIQTLVLKQKEEPLIS